MIYANIAPQQKAKTTEHAKPPQSTAASEITIQGGSWKCGKANWPYTDKGRQANTAIFSQVDAVVTSTLPTSFFVTKKTNTAIEAIRAQRIPISVETFDWYGNRKESDNAPMVEKKAPQIQVLDEDVGTVSP
jgi:hypothetical protein